MNKYSIISGLLLVFLFSCSVSAGYVNGHNCTVNAECNSLNCNMGYCCNSGQCGSYYGCRDEGSVPFGGPNTMKCRNGSWVPDEPEKKSNGQSCSNSSECVSGNCNAGYCCNSGQCGSYYGCLGEGQCVPTSYCNSGCYNGTFKKYFGASCGSTSDCSSGTCINGFCCNANQCGYSTSKTGNCYNIGDERYIYKCVSEGTWRILDGNDCLNNVDCVSNNCFYNTCSASTTTTTTTTTSTTTTSMQCETLWWFDNSTRVCASKQFCGTYMYPGLRTFNTQSDCLEELNEDFCVGEGNNIIIVPGAADCCAGLTPINPRTVNESGECTSPSFGASICTYCGNGVCGLGENICNCPSDCNATTTTTTTTTTSTTTTSMQCEDLWWFDNSTRVCGLKQFCGEYMYYGLRTFQNQSLCLEELTGSGCVGEGNSIIIVPGAAQCCAGLTPINPLDVGEYGICNPPSVGASVCAICGNGVCGPGENKCNCPQDCPCIDGISIDANWHGSEDVSPVMQLWVDDSLKVVWDTVGMDRNYDYETNLSCGTHEIGITYNISQGTLSIYKILVECSKLNAGDIDTESSGTLTYTYTKTNCGLDNSCATLGDTPPCGVVNLQEVVDYINQWMNGEASLDDIVNLISLWTNQG